MIKETEIWRVFLVCNSRQAYSRVAKYREQKLKDAVYVLKPLGNSWTSEVL